ncbi:cobalt/nickel transport system permease protein [Motilibacter peucedani]|uniref:Cobalt/nickel transport system permease protein n=1 Tax=Motilibacter peucedani TaxID=598650 RepID=A0A420XPN2_9ACTN|nr:cobalt ECF transporter T component CbiQ [Motilibacter peucedani]RKS75223.1 cobalt/nickel transport system permease protein [Motilibacter peucedani]
MSATAPVATRTPDWLLQGEVGLCPCGCIGRRRKGSFVEKTLTGGAQLLRQVMFSEDVAARGGLLQRLDPRTKLVSLFVLLVAVGLVHNVGVLLAAYAVTLVLAAASRLPLGFFVKRVWLFVPVFTGIVVLPATLSVVTSGHVVVELWSWHGHPQGLTSQGLTSAALVVARVATSISLVVLLTLTTPWVRLLAALRAVGVPRMFVLVIGMAYRYVFLLLATVTDMYEARKARTVGSLGSGATARSFLASSAGALFGKSHHLSEEVHLAMVARGYRGDAKTLEAARFRPADALAAALTVALAAATYGGDLLVGR